MTKEEILACKLPGDLFSGPEKMQDEYMELAKTWHPDKSEGDGDVMSAINALHETGKIMKGIGEWDTTGKRYVELANGKQMKISYLQENDFLLGKEYICASACVYVLNHWGTSKIPGLPAFEFPSGRQEEFERYLPNIMASHRSKGGSTILAFGRRSHMFRLRDVLKYYDGVIPPKHVAWIISSLYNLCCFFKYNGIVHNSINIDTYFVSPSKHIGTLIGGWWYHGKEGGPMSRVPALTHMVMKSTVKSKKENSYSTDLECVKLIGRELLGSSLIRGLDKDVPWQMINFVRTSAGDDPIAEYGLWMKMLEGCYGKRKFIDMDVKPEKIYPST